MKPSSSETKNAKRDPSMRDQAVGLTIASKLRARPELLNGVREQLAGLMKSGGAKSKLEMAECLGMMDQWPLEKLFESLEKATADGIRLSRLAAFQSVLTPQDQRIIVQTTSR